MVPQDDSPDVAAWMEELARTPLNAPPVDPALLWWKAQLLRRWDAERRTTEPIEVGEQVQVGIGSVGTLVILGWLWRILATTGRMPSLAAVILVSCILLGVAVLFASLGRSITRSN